MVSLVADSGYGPLPCSSSNSTSAIAPSRIGSGSLYTLPSELLINIGLHATGLTLTILTQVCRRFRSIFTSIGETLRVDEFKTSFRYNSPYFDGHDLTTHYLALKRDISRKVYNVGRGSDIGKFFCMSCFKDHTATEGLDGKATVGSESGRCKDSETGGIQTCNHLVIPFFALQRLRYSRTGAGQNLLTLSGQHADATDDCPTALRLHFCPASHQRDFIHPRTGLGIRLRTDEKMRYTEPWTYKLVLQYTLMRQPTGMSEPSTGQLSDRLKKLTGMVCPHIAMNSSDVKLSMGVRCTETSGPASGRQRSLLWTASMSMPTPGSGWRWKGTKTCYCRHPDCDTKFRITMEWDEEVMELYLVVQRNVGRLEDVNDPKWLAQREVPLGLHPA